MLYIYLSGALFGGILLAASFVGGDDGGGHDAGGSEGPNSGDFDGHHEHHASRIPFLSLRFWAFATAFFGLTGGLLTLVGGLGLLTPVVAAGVGLGCGLVSARVLGSLGREAVGLVGDAQANLGREGRVLLPVGPGRRGKIRLTVGGVSSDLVAETEGPATLQAGDLALIVGMRDAVALVEPNPAGVPAERGAAALGSVTVPALDANPSPSPLFESSPAQPVTVDRKKEGPS